MSRRRPYGLIVVCAMLATVAAVAEVPPEVVAVGPQPADDAPRAEGSPAPATGEVTIPPDHHLRFGDALEDAALVIDGVLVNAEVRQPEGTGILVTDYTFQVIESFAGGFDEATVTLTSAGGERPDGTGMSVCGALRLETDRRYVVVSKGDPGAAMLPIARALQVFADGSAVADEAGRIVTGIAGDALEVRRVAEVDSLSYLATRPAGHGDAGPEVPPDGWTRPGGQPPEPSERTPLAADALLDWMAARLGGTRDPAGLGSVDVGALEDPGPVSAEWQWCGRIDGPHNYYSWVPDDDHWTWWGHSAGNWNTIVDDNPSGPDWLIGYFTSGGDPIRDRNPVAGDGDNHSGVVSDAQLSSGGYGGTWGGWGANGINFTWYSGGSCTRIDEVDTFVNPSIADDPAQHRKSLTHEFGHALGQSTTGAGGHEDEMFAIMYAGTWRQPPNYSSTWYGRKDDMWGVRDFLANSNSNYPGTWVFESWVDMATWSQTHDNWGSAGNLVMTDLDDYSGYRGDTVTVRHIQVENRGNQPASNVWIRFYLSTNTTITDLDHEAGSGFWSTFNAHGHWADGSWDITIPSDIPAGSYYIGWILTLDDSERSTANNTAIMLRDAFSNFSERTFTVLGQPDLLVPTFGRTPSTVQVGGSLDLSATVRNDGDGSSSSTTLRYYRSTNAIISPLDTEIGTDFVTSLSPGGQSPESATVTMPSAGTYWVGACVDEVSNEDDTGNQCSAALMVTVLDPDIFSDGFESGTTSAWSSIAP